MSSLFLLVLIGEIWAAMFVVWGFCHEDKLIMLERKISERWRK